MMRSYKNILGSEIALNSREACVIIEQAISEGLQLPFNASRETKNLFGRQLTISQTTDLSFTSGLAATGLRATAIVKERNILDNTRQLEQAVRQQLPIVVLAEYQSQQQVHPLSESGALIWLASSVQEVIDFILIAHRIAELALLPIVIGIDNKLTTETQNVKLPDSTALLSFLGNPDSKITSPTPSQEMLFGKSRRKVPNWFNPDIPVLIGANKDLKDQTFEVAAREQFFNTHTSKLLEKVLIQFEKIFGRNYHVFKEFAIKRAEYLLITTGVLKENALEALQSKYKKRIGLLHLNQLSPFPAKELEAILNKIKGVTVFDQCQNYAVNTPLFKEIASLQLKPVLFSAKYGQLPSKELIEAVIQNMLPGGEGKDRFWVDVPYSREESAYPKHQILNQSILREYPQSERASITKEDIDHSAKITPQQTGTPYAAKQFRDQGPAYSRMARFYDDTAALYEDKNELLADPFKATPMLPPATASLAPFEIERKQLPVFLPELCTACGECFVYCPHSAIPPLALDLESMIQSGMKMAASKGIAITQLPPMVKNLAKFGHKEIRKNPDNIQKIADFLPNAFENLAGKMKLEGDQLQNAKDDFQTVMEEIGDLNVAITDTFFSLRDQTEKDSGELFTLAIDPTSCTGCGLCTEVCDFDALQMKDQTVALQMEYQKQFHLWEQLPDTDQHTIGRLIVDKDYDSIAATLLSRNFYYSMAGGSTTEKEATRKSILHLVTSLAEAAVQARFNTCIQTVEDLLHKLSENIQTQISNALPREDYHSLLETLQESREEHVPFETMIKKWSVKEHLSLVDKKSLERKTDLVQRLKDLKWAFTEGPTGNGRSRMGIILDASLAALGEFPWNNFTNPVLLNWKGSVEMANGLIQGHIRHFLDNIKLLRRAELEVKDKYVPKIHDRAIAELNWDQLTNKERAFLPPVLLIARRSTLTENELADLIKMLNGNVPLKFILLDDAIPSFDNAESQLINSSSLLYPLVAQQKAFVVRSSLSDPDHVYKGIQNALRDSKPALSWLFAPGQAQHDISIHRWPQLHGLAQSTRAFTHFVYDPEKEGSTLSSKIELENPSQINDWNSTQLTYEEYGEEKSMNYSMTWADWAFTLKDWKDQFQLYEDRNTPPVLLADYMQQEPGSREGIPVICRIGNDRELKYYRVSDKVVNSTESCLFAWHVLLEFSGLKTEFPDQLQKKVEKEVSGKYDDDIAQLRSEYEERIQLLEQEHLQKIKAQLKEKLLHLSQRRL